MILKSYIVEKDFKMLERYKATLLYGENNGIKDDIKIKLIKNSKNAEIINLFQDEIINNKEILNNLILNTSLFSQEKVLFLHEISDKIFGEVEDCLGNLKKDVKIYIFSNQLEKKSKLRSFFEKDKNLGIIPCYQDNEITLKYYINQELKNYKGVTPEITSLIIENSNYDRKFIKSEIKKIKTYFNKGPISKPELEELLNIKTSTDFSIMADAVLSGDKKGVNRLMGEIDLLQEESFFYLNLITNKIFKLLEVKEKSNNDVSETRIVEIMKNKIFWKDRPIFINQLKRWNKNKLEKALKKIIDVELLIKKNSSIKKDLIVKELLISLCGEAATSV